LKSILCFIVLVPDHKWNRYTFELGWSKLGRLPTVEDLGHWPCFPNPDEDGFDHHDFEKAHYVCRIGSIYLKRDYWWRIGALELAERRDITDQKAYHDLFLEEMKTISEDSALEQVRVSLDESMPVLMDYGIPYLKAFVQAMISEKDNKAK
jgi:hypothetical protein